MANRLETSRSELAKNCAALADFEDLKVKSCLTKRPLQRFRLAVQAKKVGYVPNIAQQQLKDCNWLRKSFRSIMRTSRCSMTCSNS